MSNATARSCGRVPVGMFQFPCRSGQDVEGRKSVGLRVVSRDVGDQTVVEVAGEIDVATADTLRERLGTLIDRQHVDLVVDLREVSFMDSTGLGLLVGTLKRVRTAGGRLQLVIDSERLLIVFRITALEQVFTIRPSLDDALVEEPTH